jgi:hypothetical protein
MLLAGCATISLQGCADLFMVDASIAPDAVSTILRDLQEKGLIGASEAWSAGKCQCLPVLNFPGQQRSFGASLIIFDAMLTTPASGACLG